MKMNRPEAEIRAARQSFYREIDRLALAPLWEVLHALVPPQPATPCVPAIWRFAEVEPHLMRASELIGANEAVRRVLVLENPALRGQSCVTQSLYAGLQLILPGEIAPSHRHTQSALRFVVKGRGAWTAVDGERATMQPGDFIITPSWTWHDHGAERDGEPVIWLDGLDIPMLRFFDAGFAEDGAQDTQPISRTEGTSLARYGANMAPVTTRTPFGATSPVFSYPYERTLAALEKLARDAPLDDWDGAKLRYVNPATGGSPMPTMATFMQLLPAGFSGRPYRGTDGAVYSVVEGTGAVSIGRGDALHAFEFAPRDHFVVPSWWTVRLSARDRCVLFSFSDRPVQQALGILREERL